MWGDGIANVGGVALNKSKSSSNSSVISSNETSNNLVSESASNISQKYKDGTYEGNGERFEVGTTIVSVTIADGNIINIETLSYGDTPEYYERVSGTIIDSIIAKQSTSVDTFLELRIA